MEKWFVLQKKADFAAISQKYGISPVTARLIRNRDVIEDAAIGKYLNGGLAELYDPHLLFGGEQLVEILAAEIKAGAAIRIIGDYDIDGVMSTYILYQAFQSLGADVSVQIPDRMKDGYGLNMHLIDRAAEDGVEVIVTCDNGIAALDEIAHAKELGMTVLVTDHHEIPYRGEEDGSRVYLRSQADAIVNPKQQECQYPYKELCGAAVAFKVVQLLYEQFGRTAEDAYEFLEYVAFATVGDVMDLTDENRILVKEGLKRLHQTKNPGMRALILQNNLAVEQVHTYHIGFVLGPCINASGRLETARIALNLFLAKSGQEAAAIAQELVDLNERSAVWSRRERSWKTVRQGTRFMSFICPRCMRVWRELLPGGYARAMDIRRLYSQRARRASRAPAAPLRTIPCTRNSASVGNVLPGLAVTRWRRASHSQMRGRWRSSGKKLMHAVN